MRKYTRSTLKTMSIAALLCLAVGLPTLCAGADPGTLVGTTVDFDGKPVKKVSVLLTSTDDPEIAVEATSNKKGVFELAVDNPTLTYEIRFEKSGFVAMKSSVDFKPGQSVERTFTMLTQQDVDQGKGEIVRQRELASAMNPAIDLYNQGVTAFSNGDLDAARGFFESALELNSTMEPALAALSVIAMQQEDWTTAADAAARTLALNPGDTRALFAAYRSNTALGNAKLATEAAAALTAAGENSTAAARIFNEGADAYRAHDVDKAKLSFEEALALDPTMVDALGALAAISLSQGRLADADSKAAAMLALDPGNSRALKIRFEVALAEHSDRLAAAMAELAAVDATYVSTTVNERAFNLFEQNRYDDAKQLVELMLELDPDDARANYTLGLILVNAGDNADARAHLQKFIDGAPDDPDSDGARAMLEQLQ